MNLREIGWDGLVWIGLICLRIGTSGGLLWKGNKPPGSIKCWEVLEWLHNLQLLKKSSAPWVSVWTINPNPVSSHLTCDYILRHRYTTSRSSRRKRSYQHINSVHSYYI
jgi:hypothetical protein